MPLSTILASTFFMSQGARNWPFFTLTDAPGLRRRDEQVGLPAEEGRDLQHVDDLRHLGALRRLVHVGQHRQPEFRADLGEDRQRAFQAHAALAREAVRFALSNSVL